MDIRDDCCWWSYKISVIDCDNLLSSCIGIEGQSCEPDFPQFLFKNTFREMKIPDASPLHINERDL